MHEYNFKIPESFNKKPEDLFTRNHEGPAEGSVINQLQELIGQYCKDDYEKYQLLDTRDKLLCNLRTISPARFGRTGTCPDLCPEKERYVRIVQKRLSIYECDQYGKLIPPKAVKEYARSAADQERPLPHELRDGQILEKSMEYLLTTVVDSNPRPDQLTSWYDFLWSRTRAIRKEITQQMMVEPKSVSIVQRCARFHIFASYALCTLEMGEFNQNMNTENIGKSLQTLRHLYEDLAKRGIGCREEAEFRSYDIMMHLDDTNTTNQALSYRKEVRESEHVRLALQLATSLQNGNYARFFRLLKTRASFLQICACHRYFDRVRANAYRVMVKAYGRNNNPLEAERVANMLGFDDVAQLAANAGAYGLRCDVDGLDPARDTYLGRPEETPPLKLYAWIDAKMQGAQLSQILTAGAMLCVPSLDAVIDSFDEEGHYVKDPVLASYVNMETVPKPKIQPRPPKNSTPDLPKFVFNTAQPIERKIAQWSSLERRKNRLANVCNEFFLLDAKQLVEQSINVSVSKELSTSLTQKATQESSVIHAALSRQILEGNLKREKEEKKEALRNEARTLLPRMFEEKLKTEVDKQIMIIFKQIFCAALKDAQLEYEKQLFNKIWKHHLLEIIDGKTKEISAKVLDETRASQAAIIDGIGQRLRLLWLRQFWDQWRRIVEARRMKREYYRKIMNEWRPSRLEYISKGKPQETSKSAIYSSWRRYSDGNDFFKEQKRKRWMISKYFHRWRLNAQRLAARRRIIEGFISRKRHGPSANESSSGFVVIHLCLL
ncbi:unnamed protein product, partial [Mesorhabditis belari]|uniref:SAC3/GANP/THP3 conserved domain-containing protein n=1 Tax=Mesorhabditis belari TaxID=2138241 RepID=A0AAF3EZE0_9BILA